MTEGSKVSGQRLSGFALSLFLFAGMMMMMDRLTEEVTQKSPLAVMFADDTALRRTGGRWKKTWRYRETCSKARNQRLEGIKRLQQVKKLEELKYLRSKTLSNGKKRGKVQP